MKPPRKANETDKKAASIDKKTEMNDAELDKVTGGTICSTLIGGSLAAEYSTNSTWDTKANKAK